MSKYLKRCPHTPDGRLPLEEMAACEFCQGTHPCNDFRVPIPPDLEPGPDVTCSPKSLAVPDRMEPQGDEESK